MLDETNTTNNTNEANATISINKNDKSISIDVTNNQSETKIQPTTTDAPLPLSPASRADMFRNLQQETSERLTNIQKDFADGFEVINKYDDTVTIFGSARLTPESKHYQKAVEISGMLADNGYTVITGGGGGIMEAGNKGAFESGGNSIGLNIQLPHEQVLNPYTTDEQSFRYFFSRKVMLAFAAEAFIFFPGGFGTLDELFEILTLIQTGKVDHAPVILIGNEFWKALDEFIISHLLEDTYTISPGDEKLYTITEDPIVIKQILDAHDRSQTAQVLSGIDINS